MKIYAPSYYNDFKCISRRCKHNCCIGWEIDVDEDTLEYYKSIDGILGKKLQENIDFNESPHFKLTEGERCPFLNGEGLCDLIINLGENSLCQICRDHPRFKNYFNSRLEIGLGLCCEAACDLILNQTEGFSLTVIGETNDEGYNDTFANEFFEIRNSIFDLLNKEDTSFRSNLQKIIKLWDIKFTNTASTYWCEKLAKLERLDNNWDKYLLRLKSSKFDITKINFDGCEKIAENLLFYFIYRLLSNSLNYDDVKHWIKFCILSLYIIMSITDNCNDINEVARMYSGEIEYSDENIYTIMNLL